MGVHHDTVRRALALERVSGTGVKSVRPTLLDPYKDFLQATPQAHPKLTASRLFHRVKARGDPGGPLQVRRYVRTVRPESRAEAFLRRTTLPGEEAQVDWGHFGKVAVGGTKRTLCCFVRVLGHSRAMDARFFLDMTLERFLKGHVLAFEALGGVPRAAVRQLPRPARRLRRPPHRPLRNPSAVPVQISALPRERQQPEGAQPDISRSGPWRTSDCSSAAPWHARRTAPTRARSVCPTAPPRAGIAR